MAKISFSLAHPKRESSSIYALVFFSSNMYKIPCGVSVKTAYWLKDSHRASVSNVYQKGKDINDRLNTISDAMDIVSKTFFKNAQIPSMEEFKNAVDQHLNPKDDEEGLFTSFMEEHHQTLTRGSNTTRRYVTTLNQLKDLEKKRKKPIHFSDFDMNLYNEIKRHFSANEWSLNYFGDFIKNIKAFFHAAGELKLHPFILPEKFIVPNVESDSIYLNVDELLMLHNLVINENLILDALGSNILKVTGNINRMITSLRDCRDRFLVGAFTAMRYSDYSTLKNLKHTDRFISKISQKTGVKTKIPMHKVIRDILIARDNKLPGYVSTQKMNNQLKVLGELANLNKDVEKTTTLVGGKKRKTFKQYELLTTHCARRSGCTNMFLANIDIVTIMSFSGHKTSKSFMKYIKATQDEIAEKVKDHPFFN